jgi:hypothetical protein
MVLMMNPSVGLTVVISSFMMRLTMVVLPALSSPLPDAISIFWESKCEGDVQH